MAKKTSKSVDPIGFFIDIAGAATLGLYANYKVKKDFREGCGEESAMAATTVFGLGTLSNGSRGIMSLGGLIGVNSALKSIDRDQKKLSSYNHIPFESPIEKSSAISHPLREGLWRNFCVDGSVYGISPEDYNNADDYEDALYEARRRIDSNETENINIGSQEKKRSSSPKNCWRKYCEDGSMYGISPENYKSADDYEDALNEAKNEMKKIDD